MASLPQCQSGVSTPPEVKAGIVRMYLDGALRREIMAAFGCGKSTISKVLKEFQVPPRGREHIVASEDRVEAIRSLYEEGLTMTQIGEKLGVSKNTVAGLVHRRKITRDSSLNIANKKRSNRENGRKAQYNLDLGRVVGIKRPKKEGPRQPAAFKIGTANGHVYKMPPPRDLPKFTGATPNSNPKPWIERGKFECTWPVSGEGADTFSCCAPIVPGTSWCDAHCNTGHSNWQSAKGGYHSEPKSFVAELVRRFAA